MNHFLRTEYCFTGVIVLNIPNLRSSFNSEFLLFQEWVVHLDKAIPPHTHQHNARQDMKDMAAGHQVGLGTTTIQDKEDHLQHGEDNMTKILVHQRLAMTCTTEDGVEVDIHPDLDIHKEVHQQHPQELHHHRPIIHQPPNLLINIR